MNYKTGMIKFYHDGIGKTLEKMYNDNIPFRKEPTSRYRFIPGPMMKSAEESCPTTGQYKTSTTPDQEDEEDEEEDDEEEVPRPSKKRKTPSKTKTKTRNTWDFELPSDASQVKDKVCFDDKVIEIEGDGKVMGCVARTTPANGDDIWDSLNVAKIRKSNEKARMGYHMKQLGIPFVFGHRAVDLVNFMDIAYGDNANKYAFQQATVEFNARQPEPRGREIKRKKRSSDREVEKNVTVHSLAIVDEDSSFNFKVKECKIWEESEEGEVLETHVYDFERKVLIEDNNTGGSSPNATYIEEGVLEDAEEVPAPEEEQIETISIVLRPRGN